MIDIEIIEWDNPLSRWFERLMSDVYAGKVRKVWDVRQPRDGWERMWVLRKGVVHEVLCDRDVYEHVKGYSWFISAQGYAYSRLGKGRRGKWVYLHRLATNAPAGMQVDHINRNRLDNRRANLRLCTRRQNLWNAGISSTNTSGYKGVSWDKKNKKWEANLRLPNKSLKIGRFAKLEDAVMAYNHAVKKHRGEFAVTNKVDKKLLHDVAPTPDNWSRGYAQLEYKRMGMHTYFAKKIEVKHVK